jgi:hypothetical protein
VPQALREAQRAAASIASSRDGQDLRRDRHGRHGCLNTWALPQTSRSHGVSDSATGEVTNQRIHSAFTFVNGRVCGSCNSAWMSRLENAAKPMLIPLIEGTRAAGGQEEWIAAGPSEARECRDVKWCFEGFRAIQGWQDATEVRLYRGVGLGTHAEHQRPTPRSRVFLPSPRSTSDASYGGLAEAVLAARTRRRPRRRAGGRGGGGITTSVAGSAKRRTKVARFKA